MSFVTIEGNIIPYNRDKERAYKRQINELSERIAMLEKTIEAKNKNIEDLKQKLSFLTLKKTMSKKSKSKLGKGKKR